MKNRLSRIGVLMMAVVLGVGAMGASFAAFTDEMVIDGTVDTATVKYEVVELSETFVYKDMTDSGLVRDHLVRDLGAARQYRNDPPYLLVAEALASWSGDSSTLTLDYNNIFPCNDYCADVVIHYTGSIPAHISLDDIVWDGELGTALSQYMTVSYEYKPSEGDWQPVPGGAADVQLHYCDHLRITFCLHIPQDNSLQGDGTDEHEASFSTKLNLFQWNECIEVQKILDMPDEKVHLDIQSNWSNPGGYFLANFSTGPTGQEPPPLFLDPNMPAWCCEDEASSLMSVDVFLKSSLDDEPYVSDPAWHYVNYILNQPAYWSSPYDNYSPSRTIQMPSGVNARAGSPMQVAFWYFLIDGMVVDQDDWPTAWVIIQDALDNGAGFMPGSGQLAAVICQDGTSFQKVFVAIDP